MINMPIQKLIIVMNMKGNYSEPKINLEIFKLLIYRYFDIFIVLLSEKNIRIMQYSSKTFDNLLRKNMKYLIKWIVSILSLALFLTSASLAEKKFVPIMSDDLLSFASYYTTTNNLQIPIPSYENEFNELVVQCEEDISYFVMSYQYYDAALVTVDNGDVVIDEKIENNVTDDGEPYIKGYIKGHIEGNESIAITGSSYYQNELRAKKTKTCNSNITSVNTLEVPTFNGNSQGKLVIQCEVDVVYYIMAYDCLRWDTNPSVTTDNGIAVTDEKRHVGEVFYVKGHVERTEGPVTIMGHVYSGGKDLYRWPDWTQTCP